MAEELIVNDKLSAPREMREEVIGPRPAPMNVPNSELNHGGSIPLGGPPAAPQSVQAEEWAGKVERNDWKPGDKFVFVKGAAPGDTVTS